MKVRRDLFKVASGARDEGGHKMDPEEQPTARIITTDAPASLGGVDTGKSLAAEVVAYSDAGEVGLARSSLCANCRYFDRTWWVATVRDAENGTHEERQSVNAVRSHIIEQGGADLDDLESELRTYGKCHALSEHQKDLIVVHPGASCPKEVRSVSMPLGFYKPTSTEAEKDGVSGRDKILFQAAGRI